MPNPVPVFNQLITSFLHQKGENNFLLFEKMMIFEKNRSMDEGRLLSRNTFQEMAAGMLEGLGTGVLFLDEEGLILYANEAACRRHGYPSGGLTGLPVQAVNPLTTPGIWARRWEKMQREGQDQFSAVHRDRSGKEFPVEVFAVFFSNNRKKCICSIFRDISQSRRYRQLLEETEKAAQIGGWEWNLADRQVLASQEALSILGTEDPDGLLPAGLLPLTEEGFREMLQQAFRRLLNDHTAFDLSLPVHRSPAFRKWIRLTARAAGSRGRASRVIGTIQDITAQRLLEQSLRLTQRTVDNARDMIYWIRPDGTLAYVNDSVCRELGYPKEYLLERTIFDIDPVFPQQRWAAHWEEIRRLQSFLFETTHQRQDGRMIPVEVQVNYLHYDGQEFNCAIVRDITERKQREAELLAALEEVGRLKSQAEAENEYLQEEIRLEQNFGEIITVSPSYQSILRQVEQVAPTDATVLITGESGTGKELLARAVHRLSMRAGRPLIKVNCAALPADLIESELFGHEKGAFTGATQRKTGRFELAHRGTLFLDEIGELPLSLQAKLLRVLQEGEYERLGNPQTLRVDVRIIAATNRDLEQMVREKAFREDLFYRLNVFPVHNPALRERREDIPVLLQYFVEKFSRKLGKPIRRIARQVVESLRRYDFPGNIRELENLLERAVILERGNVLTPGEWMPRTEAQVSGNRDLLSFGEMQREHILRALALTKGRVSGPQGAASLLKLNPKTLFAKMNKLGIRREDYPRGE